MKKELTMTTWYSSEIDTVSARPQKVTALRRPLLVGALAAGMIAIGASTALAASPLGSPSPRPSTAWGQGMSTSMMSGTSMGMMLGTTASMMSGASMGTMHGTTSMMSGASRSMMGSHGTSPPPASSTGTTTGMMGSTSTGAMSR